MPRFQINQIPISDKNFLSLVNKFKSYCTVRRDLRMVDEICSYIVSLHGSIKTGETKLETIQNSLFLVKASSMYAILLYSRWFKSTNGKVMLKPRDFFSEGSNELLIHERIIEYRDKYVAHNELDLLGEDRVWVNTDEDGHFIATDSDWLEQPWLQDEDLNMSVFQKCVHIVHNKIDAETLPVWQSKLDDYLKKLPESLLQQNI